MRSNELFNKTWNSIREQDLAHISHKEVCWKFYQELLADPSLQWKNHVIIHDNFKVTEIPSEMVPAGIKS